MVTLNKVSQGVSGHWSQPLEAIAKLSTLNADGVLEEGQICHHEGRCKHRVSILTHRENGTAGNNAPASKREAKIQGLRHRFPTN